MLNIITIEAESDQIKSILKNIACEVSFPLSEEDKKQIAQIKEYLYEFGGVGLAAPQVGIAKKIAAIYIPEDAASFREDAQSIPMLVIINPEYYPVNPNDKKEDFESCYSVENVAGKVSRFCKINVKYHNEQGKIINELAEGFYARVLQHEIDHLNGLLITDRLTPDCKQGDRLSMMKLRREELSEDKRKLFDELLKKKGVVIDDE